MTGISGQAGFLPANEMSQVGPWRSFYYYSLTENNRNGTTYMVCQNMTSSISTCLGCCRSLQILTLSCCISFISRASRLILRRADAGDRVVGQTSEAFAFQSPAGSCDVHWPPFEGYPCAQEPLSSAEQLLQDSCEGLLELANLSSLGDGPQHDALHQQASSPDVPAPQETHLDDNLLQNFDHRAKRQHVEVPALEETRPAEQENTAACKPHRAGGPWEIAAQNLVIESDHSSEASVHLMEDESLGDQGPCQVEDGADLDWDAWVAECLAAGPIPPRSCSPIVGESLLRAPDVYHQPTA